MIKEEVESKIRRGKTAIRALYGVLWKSIKEGITLYKNET